MTPQLFSRRQDILDIVTKYGYARVADLAEKLGVTTVTIRSDLQYLEDNGLLERSHGGAIAKKALLSTSKKI